jgi:hypothetical protein
MTQDSDPQQIAGALRVSIGLLVRRLRQVRADGDLTLPESSALARLDRGGPATSAALEERGLVRRGSDPQDGRLVVLSVSAAGRQALRDQRDAGTRQLAQALSAGFTRSELRQLMAAAPLLERLAEGI